MRPAPFSTTCLAITTKAQLNPYQDWLGFSLFSLTPLICDLMKHRPDWAKAQRSMPLVRAHTALIDFVPLGTKE